MEYGRDKSINEIIERAKQEKNRMIQAIHYLLADKLPAIMEEFERVADSFADMAKEIDIDFQLDEDMKNVITTYISNLTTLEQELQQLKLDDETVLSSSVIEKAQQIIPLVGPSLEKAKSKFYNSNREKLLESNNKREEVKAEIEELKMQKSYLQGKLDVTRRKKVKAGIQVEIDTLDSQIKSLEDKLEGMKFKEEVSSQKSTGEEITPNQGEKVVQEQEEQAVEPHDDGNR